MFSAKCANPDCELAFDYRHGHFFRFHDNLKGEPTLSSTHGVRHFWLCDTCSREYTLRYVDGAAALIPLEWQHPTKDQMCLAAART